MARQHLEIEAIYENGVFKPLSQITGPVKEGERVHLVVKAALSPEEMLKLAASVYEGLSAEEIDEIEKISLDRRPWFADREAL